MSNRPFRPSRREFLRSTLAAGATLGAVAALPGAVPLAAASPARRRWPGYDGAMVIDALGGPGAPGFRESGGLSASTLQALRRSGVTATNVTMGVVGGMPDPYPTTLADLAWWDEEVGRHPDSLLKVLTSSDLNEAKAGNRHGIIYGFQDAVMLEGDASRVAEFQERGVRIIQLTYNRANRLGYGAMEDDRGLTDFGHEVVSELNRTGVLVDLSHCGHRTTLAGIAASASPVAVTHSGCHALAALPRNKPDEVLRALADAGGVVGIYFMPFLREQGQPMAEDVIAHIEHAWNVCGEDHVGIGTDGSTVAIEFNEDYRRRHREDVARRRAAGISAPGETEDVYIFIPDLNDERRLERLADRLSARGHSDARIEKLLGTNFQRLFGEVWS
jgi:membrane dipeptidase